MNERSKQASDLLNRRSFIKGGAGAVLAAGCLHALGRSATTLAAQPGEGARREDESEAQIVFSIW